MAQSGKIKLTEDYKNPAGDDVVTLQLKHRKLYKKLNGMNLAEAIKEQRRRYPELKQMSNELLSQMIIQHVI